MNINRLAELKHHFLTVTQSPNVKTILDLGAGYGLFQHNYPHIGADIWSVDKIDSEYNRFTICQMMYGEEKCVISDVWKLDMFEDDFFDFVVFNEVIEHIKADEVEMTLKEIKRVLKKDGLLQVVTPNIKVRKLVGKYMANEFHVKEFSYQECVDLFTAHDFEIEYETGILEIKDVKDRVNLNFGYEDPDKSYIMYFHLKNKK